MFNSNIPLSARSFFTAEYSANTTNDLILLYSSEEACIKAYDQCKFFTSKTIYYFPSLDIEIYDRSFCSLNILLNRSKILTNLAIKRSDGLQNDPRIIIMHAKNFIKKLPSPDIFRENSLTINVNNILSMEKMLQFLVQNGFARSANAVETGEFAVRGQIVDIVSEIGIGHRVLFNMNIIEEIKTYDVNTQISNGYTNTLTLFPISEIIFNTHTLQNFKNNYLKNFGVNHTQDPMFLAIISMRKFPGYENLLPLFYTNLVDITAYLNDPIIIYDNFVKQTIVAENELYKTTYESRIESNRRDRANFYPALPPAELILSCEETASLLNSKHNIFLSQYGPDNIVDSINLVGTLHKKDMTDTELLEITMNNYVDNSNTAAIVESDDIVPFSRVFHPLLIKTKSYEDELFKFIDSNINSKLVFILCKRKSHIEKIKNILIFYKQSYLEITNLHQAKLGIINIALVQLDYSFIAPKHLFISYSEIFEYYSPKEKLGLERLPSTQTSKKRLKNILMELEGIAQGEYVIHKEHGIGQFLALENVIVEGIGHDCIKILYADNAKLYIPVENIENIKKYGYPDAELDKLGGASWQKRKSKIKERITEIATKLLEVAAKRKSQTVNPIIIDIDGYTKFCNKFHYVETDDQLRAIGEVSQDLLSGKIMDRLICGDVGFGKTEVALRAAFLVASDKGEDLPQVAIIVPTTILCKQHYIRFLERFDGTGLNVVELSRFVSTTQIKPIKENIASGKANIIIGTHALLSKDIRFYNLKLVIIDEEQHFGVVQKERLKELKSSIHVLSLSATPIPRTLQMSMVGLKELSLITTPPMDRIPIRTMILPFDLSTIREALLKEYAKGGKSFYVVPRIADIQEVEKRISTMVPELKYKIIHGGLPATQIDKIMSEFYNDKVDILLSTAIIESGIDIATANTIIIHKADQFGLAQIYQLRGRIGRGKIKAFAYLTLEKNKLTEKAQKRLEIMNNIENTGGGFTVASHDMDSRGFGNLVGEQQAGHIKEVGIELYQEMLDEQMAIIQPNNTNTEKESLSPTINLGIPVFINESYINDSSLRLGLYRRIGSLSSYEEIENFTSEMIDRFGPLPIEFKNLIGILRIKLKCIEFYIESLDVGLKGAVFKFYNKEGVDTIVMEFIKKFPGRAKIKPNNKLIFIQNFNKDNIINEVLELLNPSSHIYSYV